MSYDYNALLDELERDRDELNSLIALIRKRAGMAPFGGPARAAEPEKSETESDSDAPKTPYPRREPGPKPKDPICEVHPDNAERAGNGQCRICAREYARKRYQARKNSGGHRPPLQEAESAAGSPAPLQQEPPKRRCLTHPGAEFYASSGQCKQCASEKAKARRAGNGASTPPVPEAEEKPAELPPDVERELVYSVKTRCSKCQNITRLVRPKDAPVTGSWTCMMRGCQIKIGHIMIAVDKSYHGAA